MSGQLNTGVLSVPLAELTRRFCAGPVRIPAFSRPFSWSSREVVRLFDSILRGYPVGAMIVGEGPAGAELVRVGGIRIEAPATDRAWSMVDGTQRLVAIIGVLAGGSTEQQVHIADRPSGVPLMSGQ